MRNLTTVNRILVCVFANEARDNFEECRRPTAFVALPILDKPSAEIHFNSILRISESS